MRGYSTWEIHRPVPIDDGAGGQTITMVQVATARGDVRELVGRELIQAQVAGAEHTHTGYFNVRADIDRNDELHRDADRLLVLTASVTYPQPFGRLRVTARRVEAGG